MVNLPLRGLQGLVGAYTPPLCVVCLKPGSRVTMGEWELADGKWRTDWICPKCMNNDAKMF